MGRNRSVEGVFSLECGGYSPRNGGSVLPGVWGVFSLEWGGIPPGMGKCSPWGGGVFSLECGGVFSQEWGE